MGVLENVRGPAGDGRGSAIGNERARKIYAGALFADPAATLDDLREAVTTLEETERITRRVFGGAHPATTTQEKALRNARAALRARETPPPSGSA